MNRPVSVKTAVGTETVSYDKAGRITEKALGATGERVTYSYNADGTVKQSIRTKHGNIVYSERYEYDKNGNLKKKVDFYGIHLKTETYTYTAFGELKTAKEDNFFAEYYYGADGFRSGKKVNGVSTGYVYDGMYIVGESVDGVNYTYSRGTDLLGYTSSLGDGRSYL